MNLTNIMFTISILIYLCALLWVVIYIWKGVKAFKHLEKEINDIGLKLNCVYRIEKDVHNDACFIKFIDIGIGKFPYISCIIIFDDGNIDIRKYKWDVIKEIFINNKIKIA